MGGKVVSLLGSRCVALPRNTPAGGSATARLRRQSRLLLRHAAEPRDEPAVQTIEQVAVSGSIRGIAKALGTRESIAVLFRPLRQKHFCFIQCRSYRFILFFSFPHFRWN